MRYPKGFFLSPSKLKAVCLSNHFDAKVDPSVFVGGNFNHKFRELWLKRQPDEPVESVFEEVASSRAEFRKIATPQKLDLVRETTEVFYEPPTENILSIEGSGIPERLRYEYRGKQMFQIPVTESWGIRGIVDLAYTDNEKFDIVIVDYKGITREDIDIQAACYYIAAKHLWNWGEYGIRFEAWGIGGSWWSEVREYPNDDETYETIVALIDKRVQRYREAESSGVYPAIENQWCKTCSLLETCPTVNGDELLATPQELAVDLDNATGEQLIEADQILKDKINGVVAFQKALKKEVIKRLRDGHEIKDQKGRPLEPYEKGGQYAIHDLAGAITIAKNAGVSLQEIVDLIHSRWAAAITSKAKETKRSEKDIKAELDTVRTQTKSWQWRIKRQPRQRSLTSTTPTSDSSSKTNKPEDLHTTVTS